MESKLPNLMNEISQSDWEKTPESVKRLVVNMLEQIEQLSNRIELLEQQSEALTAQNQLLKEQVEQNSQNSSKPPSQDGAKGFKHKPSPSEGKKKRGAQSGHEGHRGTMYPIEQCQSVEDYYPSTCVNCEK